MTTTINHKPVLLGARITEKSAIASDANVYVFNVATDATKAEIKKEIKRIYKVDPVKINTVNTLGKKVFVRGKFGKKNDIKKAYVYLKKGDEINII